MNRQTQKRVSLVQWLRMYDEKKEPPKKYRDGTTLLGSKLCSPNSDQYYFQKLVIHLPHLKNDGFAASET